MSYMTVTYKQTKIDLEFSMAQDQIDIESMEIGGVDVSYLLSSLDEEIELKSLIREQLYNER
jgi:hypothetical protein